MVVTISKKTILLKQIIRFFTLDSRAFLRYITNFKGERDVSMAYRTNHLKKKPVLPMKMIRGRVSGKFGHILTEITKLRRMILEVLKIDFLHSFIFSGN